MKLGDQQRCWPGDFGSVYTVVILGKGRDVHLGVIPKSRFEPDGPSCRPISVGWDLAVSPAPATSYSLRHHQIHRYALRPEPCSGLPRSRVKIEACLLDS